MRNWGDGILARDATMPSLAPIFFPRPLLAAFTVLVPWVTKMSQSSRPSYLDYAEDNDDVLNKSWDVDSRYRLQEKALKLQESCISDISSKAGGGAEVFRARVELGLHELTAALSSLR